MTEEYYSDDAFKSQLDAEGLLLMHMNRIAMYRDTDYKRYCSSVETFIILCPRHIRDRAMSHILEIGLQRGNYTNITEEKKVQYDDLLIFICEHLEKQKMIWKRKTTKTYE